MPRPISATVHCTALSNNLALARRLAPAARVWAVVKANGYGHGLARVFSALNRTDGFALLDLDEAVRLRELGWAGPVALLEGVFRGADIGIVDRYGLTVVVHCDEQLRMLETARLSKPVNVFLKMNSGMNRLGYTPERYRAAWERARGCPGIGQIGLMTHFANADDALGVDWQLERFERGAAGIAGARSLANSAATLWHPKTHGDWIRPGVMLYGASPSGDPAAVAGAGLRAAMTLASEIIAVQQIGPGERVGYGGRFAAHGPLRIGVVACGYADGYPRSAPDGTPVLVGGVRTRLVGRISMDMMTVDLTPCPGAGIGTAVQLWGASVPVDEVAQACGTIGYELMCAVTARVPMRAE
jgi:alanine racemase